VIKEEISFVPRFNYSSEEIFHPIRVGENSDGSDFLREKLKFSKKPCQGKAPQSFKTTKRFDETLKNPTEKGLEEVILELFRC
jgi:hypothetical protein